MGSSTSRERISSPNSRLRNGHSLLIPLQCIPSYRCVSGLGGTALAHWCEGIPWTLPAGSNALYQHRGHFKMARKTQGESRDSRGRKRTFCGEELIDGQPIRGDLCQPATNLCSRTAQSPTWKVVCARREHISSILKIACPGDYIQRLSNVVVNQFHTCSSFFARIKRVKLKIQYVSEIPTRVEAHSSLIISGTFLAATAKPQEYPGPYPLFWIF